MSSEHLNIVILGLSITSSWGNGHATTYRGLVRELTRRGHDILFLERDAPWYAGNRDMPNPPFGRTEIYTSLQELKDKFSSDMKNADLVIVGSYVPEGIAVGEWVTSNARGATIFYDIDTPVTLAGLEAGGVDYLTTRLIPHYSMYLSFTGGPTLEKLERWYGAQHARALYCSVDPELYMPKKCDIQWDLGYLGTYSDDRQRVLHQLMLEPALTWSEGKFIVAGPKYPNTITWPDNVQRVIHLSPREHKEFYCSQRFTLNVTRSDMVNAGFSPSVRLFEAAACGTPIISDWWKGLEIFFEPDKEILISRSAQDTLRYLKEVSEKERVAIGRRARRRVLEEHTAAHRAEELEGYAHELLTN